MDLILSAERVEFLLNTNLKMENIRAYISNYNVVAKITVILQKEGSEFTDNPHDAGGATKWGVTERTARSLGYKGSMKLITLEKAILIAAYEFYMKPRLHLLKIVNEQFEFEAFDAAYLIGGNTMIKYIQRILNVMNRLQQDWPDLEVDGIFGPKGQEALKRAVEIRGEEMLIKHLRGVLYSHFFTLTEKRETDETFFNGWVANRIGAH